jgi:signal peptidase I
MPDDTARPGHGPADDENASVASTTSAATTAPTVPPASSEPAAASAESTTASSEPPASSEPTGTVSEPAGDDPDAAATDGSSGNGVPASNGGEGGEAGKGGRSGKSGRSGDSAARATGHFLKELVIIVVIALVASALLRAFVVQAFFVPSGSMLPTIQLNDRILVSRIGDVQRGEVVVFEDPGGWIPADEQAPPPGKVRKAFEFVGVLPASGHEHLVKRVIGLPGDHVVCCDKGELVINGQRVDESDFLNVRHGPADNDQYDVVVPKDHIFVLGDNRDVSGDSSVHLPSQDAFVPMDLVTGRAFAVIWPFDHRKILHIPDAYDDVPEGLTPPDKGVINPVSQSGG